MIGFVVVSHSEPLAHAAVELAMQMIHGDAPPVRVAAGADGGFGTDAVAIAAAIDELADADGVLVLTDLGSAVLSSELALELRESTQPVRISGGPFVEGATAGIVRAATGGTLDEVAAEAAGALAAKQPHGEDGAPAPADVSAPAVPADAAPSSAPASDDGDVIEREVTLLNPLGLHSRPASLVVKAASGHHPAPTLTDLTNGHGPAAANSLISLLALGAEGGHTLAVRAEEEGAAAAVDALVALIGGGFGESG
ncbi:HPr family phosphocarrier protein [Microbacterium flavum]|uniref:Phosphocarrier protein HPr n=1 Tax=Microbacterium flavum TaxID=415216 RepID=A0ABS5XVK4_9MICO|nr:HPr family phosphocarrier protein [Microbacterium flavum]MBT8797976.1 HPr family phosphocarrier protein [Microbacterium flavum]